MGAEKVALAPRGDLVRGRGRDAGAVEADVVEAGVGGHQPPQRLRQVAAEQLVVGDVEEGQRGVGGGHLGTGRRQRRLHRSGLRRKWGDRSAIRLNIYLVKMDEAKWVHDPNL